MIFLFGAYLDQKHFVKSGEKCEIPKILEDNNYSISLMVDFGEGNIETIKNINVQKTSNLLSILQELSNTNEKLKDIKTQDYGDMGVLITSINGYTNGNDGNYWQYYVNNEQPMLSIDKYILLNNDVVELKFTKSKF